LKAALKGDDAAARRAGRSACAQEDIDTVLPVLLGG
jgi:hypothetical protein